MAMKREINVRTKIRIIIHINEQVNSLLLRLYNYIKKQNVFRNKNG
jgi:hypothetical protein